MTTLQQEAEEHSPSGKFGNKYTAQESFKAGANSKYVKQQILQAQIDENNSIIELVKLHSECINERILFVLNDRIHNLQQQLKELET